MANPNRHFWIAILVAAAVVMPWVAKQKRRLAEATSNAALRTDAAQSALCAYLSLAALGLAIKAIWHVNGADPIAVLAIIPLVVWGLNRRVLRLGKVKGASAPAGSRVAFQGTVEPGLRYGHSWAKCGPGAYHH